MVHYIDIKLLPDPEIPAHQLMAALYAKLHRALVQLQSTTIAVSFPGYKAVPTTLGATVRLIGAEIDLARLMGQGWTKGLHDHMEVMPVDSVPANTKHRSLRRVQAKSSPERLRRRHMRRHGLTGDQAKERVPDSTAELLHLPFLVMASTSTRQTFPIFLRLGPVEPTARAGAFNAYGLSTTATIPWF